METKPESSGSAEVRALLEDRIAARDRAGAVLQTLAAVDSATIDVPTLYAEVLTPLMRDVGSRWQQGHTRVWEEHLATAIVRGIVEALYPTVQRLKASARPTGRSVLLACPADEQHDLGLRMLADLFDIEGWTTYLLGADTPTRQIADAASALGADLVLLSSTTLADRVQVRHVLGALQGQLPSTRIVVAGCEPECADRGLEPEEIFHAEEFLGAVPARGNAEAVG